MKTQTQAFPFAAQQSDIGEARPSASLRVLFILAGLALVVAANAPIAALAARVIS